MITSYAQNFEDVMLWRALKDVERGFYIDIGAQDPCIDSVSLLFYEQGWRGVHIEPSARYADALRCARPDETVIQAAVSANEGILSFHEFPDTGISTAVDEIAAQHRKRGYRDRQVDVPCVTLESILDRYRDRDVHWMKIDVEGFEHEVLGGWGASTVRPWVIVVESMLPLTQVDRHDRWESMLTERGYRAVYFDGLNRYYVAPEHDTLRDAFEAPPNVFDDFALGGNASAPFHRGIVERDKAELAAAVEKFHHADSISQQRIRDLTNRVAQLDRTSGERDLAARNEIAALETSLREREQAWAERTRLQTEKYLLARAKFEESAKRASRLEKRVERRIQTLAKRVDDGAIRVESIVEQRARASQEAERRLGTALQETSGKLIEMAAESRRVAWTVTEARERTVERERTAHETVRQTCERIESLFSARSHEHAELMGQFEVRERMWSDRLHRANVEMTQQAQVLLNDAHRERAALVERHVEHVSALRQSIADEKERGARREAELLQQLTVAETVGRRRLERLRTRYTAELNAHRDTALAFAARNTEFFWAGHRFGRSAKTLAHSAAQIASVYGPPEIGICLPTLIHEVTSIDASNEKDVDGMKMSKIVFQPEFVARADGKYRLDDFLSLHDKDFVRAAYNALLKRAPDEWGERHYLARVRAGVSKIGILHDISRSDEARQHAIKVEGLDSAAFINRIFDIPVLGGLLQGVCFLGQINRHLKDLRALENHMVRMGEEMQGRYRVRIDQSIGSLGARKGE